MNFSFPNAKGTSDPYTYSAKWKSNTFCLTHATRKQSDKNSTSLYMRFWCTSFRVRGRVNNSFFSSIFRSGLKGSPWISWFKPRTAHKKVKLTWTIHRINGIPKNRSSKAPENNNLNLQIRSPIQFKTYQKAGQVGLHSLPYCLCGCQILILVLRLIESLPRTYLHSRQQLFLRLMKIFLRPKPFLTWHICFHSNSFN